MNPGVFCSGKRPFRSLSEAEKAASKTAHLKGARMRPYKCSHCGLYHYGQADRRTPRGQMKQRRLRNLETEE